jgi:hypothetical protein
VACNAEFLNEFRKGFLEADFTGKKRHFSRVETPCNLSR